ncbi:hypothetical protein [Nannocystis sp. SCPEA4]|uniref:hypothetical protein n=1 Tax=Nannocystis sp. SCPEA4 TaxID=2996787 RepID=UPI00226D4C0E|nr:hypothetical protein [Nannocystis sp. SCPEA4]MCY1059805.1 hypothetical protein [Nannocystis sp. SCPEA4]
MSPAGKATDASTGHRVAGALMIVNALLVLLESIWLPAPAQTALPQPSFSVTALVDVALGVSLLSGSAAAVKFSLVRVGLGLLCFTAIDLVTGEWLAAGMQVAVSVAFLLLLVGRAGKLRIAGAGLLFGLYVAVEALGAYIILSGNNPIAHTVLRASGELADEPAGEVAGEHLDYRLRAPGDRWYLRTSEAARRDNPLADRWLVRPELDAHIIVIAESIPGVMVSLAPMVDAVVANMRSAVPTVELLDDSALPRLPDTGRLLRLHATVDGHNVDYLVGIVAAHGAAYQIIGWTRTNNFAAVRDELMAAIDSFTLPAGSELPGAGRVVGAAAPYAITAPSERWVAASPEQQAQQNPDVDRWLMRPDVDAHLTVTLVPLDEATTAAALAQQLPGAMRSAWPTATFSPDEPFTGTHAGGQILHASVTGPGGAVEADFAIYVVGLRAFHVVALAPTPAYPGVADELRRAILSFEPPTD